MQIIKKGKTGLIPLLILTVLCLKCSKTPTDVDDKYDPPPIPPTTARGPGGPAYMAGFIVDYLKPNMRVVNTKLYVMNQHDYNDTLVHLTITSENASFLITDLPLDTVDLIFTHDNYLSAKVGQWILRVGQNSFYNPYSAGFFVDSTIAIIAVADSVGRSNQPPTGIQGYDHGAGVKFKVHVPDSVSWNIVQAFLYDTLRVYHYHDPVFDPDPGDLYDILYSPNSKFLTKERLLYFNWREEVKYAAATISVITP